MVPTTIFARYPSPKISTAKEHIPQQNRQYTQTIWHVLASVLFNTVIADRQSEFLWPLGFPPGKFLGHNQWQASKEPEAKHEAIFGSNADDLRGLETSPLVTLVFWILLVSGRDYLRSPKNFSFFHIFCRVSGWLAMLRGDMRWFLVTFLEETGGQPAARTSYENLPGDSKDRGALEPLNLMTFQYFPFQSILYMGMDQYLWKYNF